MSTPWLQNAMKSIGAASKETLRDIAPVLYDASSSVGKASKDAITLLRGNTNATAMNKLISKNIYVRTAKDMLKWTMEDLRSGKLFNEDRVTDILMGGDGSGSGMDDPDSMFSDWDMDDDASSGNVIINNNSNSSNAGFALAVNEGLRESTMAQLKGQQAMVDTMVAISGSQILQNQEIGNQIITQLTNVNNNLIAINEFNKTTMTSFVTTVTAYMEKMGKRADESSSSDDNNSFDPSSIFSGGFNLSNYGKHIKKNVKSSFSNSDVGFIHSMISDPETLKMMTANPLGMLTTFTMKAMTPKLMKKTMSQIDEAVAGFMPSLLMRIGELSESKEMGWKGKLKRWIGDVFGIQGVSNSDRNKLNPTKNITKDPAVFDGITRHTIVEIIPKYLSESVSYLKELVHTSGGNVNRAMNSREIFNFNKGRFSTVAKSRKELYEQIRSSGTDAIASGKLGRHIEANGGAAYTDKNGNYDQKALEQWNDMVTKFYDQLERMNKMIDMTNFSDNGDIMKAIKGTGYGGKMAEFLKQLMIEASKDASITTSANSDFQRARYSRKATIKDMNDNPDYYNLSAVADLSEDIDKTMDRIFGGVFGNPNEVKRSGSVVKTLSDIRYILNRGINVRITGHGPYQTFTGQETNISNINRENSSQNSSQRTQSNPQDDKDKAGPTKLEQMSTEEMINHVSENGTLYNDDTETTKRVKNIMHAMLFGNTSIAFSEVANIFSDKINGIFDKIDKDFFQPMKASLFGTKDEHGYSRNGVFSGMQQQFTDYYRSIVRQFNGKGYTDSKGQKHDDITDPSKSVVGQIKATVLDIKNTVVDYVLGPRDSETGKREKGMGLVNIFKEGIEGWSEAIFGKDKDGKPNFDPEKFKQEISDRMPNAVTGALGGAVLGSMTGGSLLGWLVGGPITGSILGLATGFASKSERFQKFLFGEKDEEGNIVKDTGIINQKMQEWFKKNKVPIIGGAVVGAAKSTLFGGGLLTGMVGNIIGGPLAGALLGSIGGIALRSETFKKFLFGDMDKGGWHKGIIPMFKGIFKKNDGTTDEGKSMLGMAGIGAGVGYLSAAVIGKMGFLGAMATPFGPIGGAIAGLALSIKASQGGFREWLFGKENEDGTKSVGILGRFANMLNAELLTPFKQGAMEFALDTRDFLIDKIMAPIEFAIEPFANAMKDLGDKIKNVFEKVGNFITSSIKEHIIEPITETIGKFILSPIRKTFGILFKLTTGIVKSIVAAPFSAIGMMANYGEYKERKRSRRMAIDDAYEEKGLLGGLIHQGKVMLNYGGAREAANFKHHRYSDWNERKKRYEADRLKRAKERETQKVEGRRNVRNRILMARYSGGELLEDSEENRVKLAEMLKNNPRKRRMFGLFADNPKFKGAATEENKSAKLDTNSVIKNADSPGAPVNERQLGAQLSILEILRKIFGLSKDNKKLKGSRKFTGGRRNNNQSEDGENPEPQIDDENIQDDSDDGRPEHKSLFQRFKDFDIGSHMSGFLTKLFRKKKPKRKGPRLKTYALGGDQTDDGMAVVGEEGPEIVRLPGGSSVFGGRKPLPVTIVDMDNKATRKLKVATAPTITGSKTIRLGAQNLIEKQREEDKADYQKQKEAGKLENIEKRKLEEERLEMERDNHENLKATLDTQKKFSIGWGKIFSKKGVLTAGFLVLLPLLIKWLLGKHGDGGGFPGPDMTKQVLNDVAFGQQHLQDRKSTPEMIKETMDDTKHLFKGDIWKWVTSDGGWDHESGAKLNFLAHIPVLGKTLLRPFLKKGSKANLALKAYGNRLKNSKTFRFLGNTAKNAGGGIARFGKNMGTKALEYGDETLAGMNMAINLRAANPGSTMKDVMKDMKLIKQGEGSYKEALETMKTFQNSGYGSMDEALGMMGYGGEGYKVLGKGSGLADDVTKTATKATGYVDDVVKNTTKSVGKRRIPKTGGFFETMKRQKEMAKLAKNETSVGNKYLASLADDGDELAKLLGDSSGATNDVMIKAFSDEKDFARKVGAKYLENAGEETTHSFWKKSASLGDDLGEAGAKLGKTFGDDGAELAAKAASFTDDAAKTAGKAGKGFVDDALKVATKSIGNLMDEFWKVAAKVSGKVASKMPSFIDDILKAIGKKFAYFTAKLTAITTKTAALAATVVGYLADQTFWVTVGAVDGLTGAARLFQIDRPDWIMVALSGAIGAFKGTTVGSILDLINEIVHSVLGLDMFHELASWVYGLIAGESKYQDLLKQKEDFKNQYLADDEAALRKQYQAYLGITGTNESQVSFDTFMQNVDNGNIKVKTESFADYNDRKHASVLGKLGRGSVNVINAAGDFLVGTDSQSWTDQLGNRWEVKDDRKGIAQVYDSSGKYIGDMSAENIDKDNWKDNGKKEGEGIIDYVVNGYKNLHANTRDSMLGRMALGAATFGMSEAFDSNNWKMLADPGAALNTMGNAIGNDFNKFGKPVWEYVKNAAGGAWDATKTGVGNAWDATKTGVGNAWDATKTGVGNAVSGAWDATKDFAKDIGKGVNDFVSPIFKAVNNVLKNIFKPVLDEVKLFTGDMFMRNYKIPEAYMAAGDLGGLWTSLNAGMEGGYNENTDTGSFVRNVGGFINVLTGLFTRIYYTIPTGLVSMGKWVDSTVLKPLTEFGATSQVVIDEKSQTMATAAAAGDTMGLDTILGTPSGKGAMVDLYSNVMLTFPWIGYKVQAGMAKVKNWWDKSIGKPFAEFGATSQVVIDERRQAMATAAAAGDTIGVDRALATPSGKGALVDLYSNVMLTFPSMGYGLQAGITKIKNWWNESIGKPFAEFGATSQVVIDEKTQMMADAAAAGDPAAVDTILATPSGEGALVDLYSNVMLTFPSMGYGLQAGITKIKNWWGENIAKPFAEFGATSQVVIDERRQAMDTAADAGDPAAVGTALNTPSGKGALVDLYSNVMLTFPFLGASLKAGVVKTGKIVTEFITPEVEALKNVGSNMSSYWKNLNGKFDGEGYQKITPSELFSFGNKSIVNTIIGSINGIFGMVWYGIRSTVEDVGKFFKDAWDVVTEPFKWVWDKIKNATKENETTKKSWSEIVKESPSTNSTPNNTNYNNKILSVDSSGKVVDKNANGGGNGGGKGGKDISLPYFSQKDPRWKNKKYGNEKMSEAGCGPNVMASVASGLGGARGGSVSPVEMADYAKEKGYRDNTGTNWNFVDGAIKDYGLGGTKQWNPNAQFIHDEVKKGNPVVLSGYSQGPYDPYTREGHYVVATGVDDNGGVTINDPRGREYSGKFDINNVANSTAVGWGVRPGGKGGGYGRGDYKHLKDGTYRQTRYTVNRDLPSNASIPKNSLTEAKIIAPGTKSTSSIGINRVNVGKSAAEIKAEQRRNWMNMEMSLPAGSALRRRTGLTVQNLQLDPTTNTITSDPVIAGKERAKAYLYQNKKNTKGIPVTPEEYQKKQEFLNQYDKSKFNARMYEKYGSNYLTGIEQIDNRRFNDFLWERTGMLSLMNPNYNGPIISNKYTTEPFSVINRSTSFQNFGLKKSLTSNSTSWSIGSDKLDAIANSSSGSSLTSNSTLWSNVSTDDTSANQSNDDSGGSYDSGGDWGGGSYDSGGDWGGGSYDSGGGSADYTATASVEGVGNVPAQEVAITEGGTWSSDLETYARQVVCSAMLALQGKLRYSMGSDRSQVWNGFTHGSGVGDCSSTISIIYKNCCGLNIGDWSGAIKGSSTGITVDNNTGGIPDQSKLLPGDVICYNGHVEMYLGNDQCIGHGGPGIGPKMKTMSSYTESRNKRGSGKKYVCTRRFIHDNNVSQVNVPPGVTPDAKYAVPGTSGSSGSGKSGGGSVGGSNSGGGMFGNIMSMFSTFMGDIGDNAMTLFLTGKWGNKYSFGGGSSDQNSSDKANSPAISTSGGTVDNFTGDFDYIGRYIKPFESGKEGSLKISKGTGDKGGVSFGTFQFPTYHQSVVPSDSKLRKFWDAYASQYPGVQPGNNEPFKKAWRDAATKDPSGFLKREIEINGTSTIGGNLNRMRAAFGNVDVDRALQEAVYSSLNIYGSDKLTMDSFRQAGVPNSDVYKQNPKDALKRFYQAKYDRVPINFKSSPGMWKGIRNRFSKEEPAIVIPLTDQKPLPEWGKPIPVGGGKGGSDDPFVELSRMSDGADITKQDFKVNTGGKYARKVGGGRGPGRRSTFIRRSMNDAGYITRSLSGGGRGGSNDAMLELLAIMINRLTDIANSSASSDAKLSMLRDLRGNTNIVSNNINGGKNGDTTVIVKKEPGIPPIIPSQSRSSKTAEMIARGF